MNNERTRLRDPVALMILRVWIENGSSLPLRADIRETNDVSQGFERTSTVRDVEAVVDGVRIWLEALIADDEARNGQDGAIPGGPNGSEPPPI